MCTHAVTDKLPHDRIPTRLNITLNSVTYITDSAARTRRAYSFVKAFARCVHQPLRFRRYISAGESGGVIAVIPVELGAEVDTYYIAGAQLALFGHTHIQHMEERNDITLLNPGTAGRFGRSGYAVVEITDGTFTCRLETDTE